MHKTFETTGGARIGWVNATWPLAKLTATPEAIRLSVRFLGDYTFTPERVVAITRYGMIPILGWGIQIRHCIADYPERVIFWCIFSPDTLLARIHEAGFQPQAQSSVVPPRRGMAFRWQTVIVALLVWNGLFLLDMVSGRKFTAIPGPFFLLGLVAVATLAALIVPAFQRIVLKPGRRVGEIRPLLHLLLLVSASMLIVMTVFNFS